MGTSFCRDSFSLTPPLLSFSFVLKTLFTSLTVARIAVPPSLQPHLLRPQGLSPTASTSTQEDTELPLPPFDVPRPRRSASPIRPLAPIPASFSDSRRQFPAYEPGAHEHGSIRPPAGVPSPERLGGPSSIPHGQARRYRSPVASDPTYPIPLRPPGPAYPGSHSLPAPIPRGSQWREGEAGPSSLAHAHPYGGVGRQITPGYPAPQPVHRRATEPGAYSSLVHSQRKQRHHLAPRISNFHQQGCMAAMNVFGQ